MIRLFQDQLVLPRRRCKYTKKAHRESSRLGVKLNPTYLHVKTFLPRNSSQAPKTIRTKAGPPRQALSRPTDAKNLVSFSEEQEHVSWKRFQSLTLKKTKAKCSQLTSEFKNRENTNYGSLASCKGVWMRRSTTTTRLFMQSDIVYPRRRKSSTSTMATLLFPGHATTTTPLRQKFADYQQ